MPIAYYPVDYPHPYRYYTLSSSDKLEKSGVYEVENVQW